MAELDYMSINPSESIPTMVEGNYKVPGGNNSFLTYLCNTHVRVKEKLCPDDYNKEIVSHLNWFENRMRPTTSGLCRKLV